MGRGNEIVDRLEEIETRLGALPPGAWTIEEHGGPGEFALYAGRGPTAHGYNLVHLSDWAHQRPAVEAVIVHAPDDLAWCLKAVDDMRSFAEDAGKLMTDAIEETHRLADQVRTLTEQLAAERAARDAVIADLQQLACSAVSPIGVTHSIGLRSGLELAIRLVARHAPIPAPGPESGSG